jgi:UTP:GlnB (protein PII) uridylyltransferase
MNWVQLRATYMGEKTVVVSLICSKRTDTMVKLCEVFESLKLKIITANITAFSGRLVKTVFVEVSPFSYLYILSFYIY